MTGYQYWLPEVRTFGLDYPLDPDIRRDGSGIVADSLDGALLRWACPCPEDDPLFAFRAVAFYPLVLLGLFWIFVPPLATVPGLIEVWRRRHEPGPAYVLWLTVLTVLFHLFYFYLAARFVAGPTTLLADLHRRRRGALGRALGHRRRQAVAPRGVEQPRLTRRDGLTRQPAPTPRIMAPGPQHGGTVRCGSSTATATLPSGGTSRSRCCSPRWTGTGSSRSC